MGLHPSPVESDAIQAGKSGLSQIRAQPAGVTEPLGVREKHLAYLATDVFNRNTE